MVYELINPSDPITFLADSNAVACACALIVGQGQYSVHDESYEDCGGMLFGASEEQVEAACREWLGMSLSEFMTARAEEIAAALDTFATIGRVERRTYDAACQAITDPEKLVTFKAEMEERNRSSLNQIERYARSWAARLRGGKREEVPAPQSVLVS